MVVDTQVPVILVKEFSIDAKQNLHALNFMKYFSIYMGCTNIDLICGRNFDVDLLPFACYFSYQGPIVRIIGFKGV